MKQLKAQQPVRADRSASGDASVRRQGAVAVNDDAALEHEADSAGAASVASRVVSELRAGAVQRVSPEEELPVQG